MKKEEVFSLFKIEDLNELPNAVMRIIEGDIRERNIIYHELMRMNGYDMSYDWFQELYENELSERKQKKQDFTPNTLGVLCSKLTRTDRRQWLYDYCRLVAALSQVSSI